MAKISDDTQVAMPIRNIISIIAGVAVATWAYFGIVERINNIETEQTLMHSDLEKNTEFRIKWPRGEMGSLPADAEQFMLIEHVAGQLEKLVSEIESGKAPFDQQQKLTLEFYETRISKLEEAIDKLKDKMVNGKD
jgi:exonuclease VII small subunit|tara:strand:- start:448 stop:855 length:408 start_codon:yes stop_codon:yes gene_type:complete